MNDIGNNSKLKPRVSRRDFLKLLKLSGLGMLVTAAGAAIFSQNEADWLDVNYVSLVLPALPGALSGVRMVQVSDIHLGGWMNIERLKQVFSLVKELHPNIIALTGDFVLSSRHVASQVFELGQMEAELKALADQFITLAVLGNHDYWFNTLAITEMLENSGVRTLVNAVHEVHIGKETIYIAGVDDVLMGKPRVDELAEKLPQNGCAILMAHEPDFADESAVTGRFDLQISGHSHGGQVNLPLIGAPVLPVLGRKYSQGLYRVGAMYQYTNRGVGMTPPYVRINCRPEITVFTLESPRALAH